MTESYKIISVEQNRGPGAFGTASFAAFLLCNKPKIALTLVIPASKAASVEVDDRAAMYASLFA